MTIRYEVVARDEFNTVVHQLMDYPGEYPHSEHLVEIMRELDSQSLDMEEIRVVKDRITGTDVNTGKANR